VLPDDAAADRDAARIAAAAVRDGAAAGTLTGGMAAVVADTTVAFLRSVLSFGESAAVTAETAVRSDGRTPPPHVRGGGGDLAAATAAGATPLALLPAQAAGNGRGEQATSAAARDDGRGAPGTASAAASLPRCEGASGGPLLPSAALVAGVEASEPPVGGRGGGGGAAA